MSAALLQHLNGSPWMIHPAALDQLVSSLRSVDVSAFEPSSAAARDGDLYAMDSEEAVIRIAGPMMRRVPEIYKWFGAMFGVEFCDIEQTREAVARAVEDSRVKSIRLSIDSPGGSTDGLDALADDVFAAGDLKPVTTEVDGMMASAALYVGAQAGSITASKEQLIGSIGTYAVIVDSSKAAESDGVKVHLITSAPGKGQAAGAPVSEEVIDNWQTIVDGYTEMFIAAVARGRGMKLVDAAALATGEIWLAEDARDLNLIDTVGKTEKTTKLPAEAGTEQSTMTITPEQLEKERTARLEAEAKTKSLEASVAAITASRREDLVSKYSDRVSPANLDATLEYGTFCGDDLGKFEAHLQSLPPITRPTETGANVDDDDRKIADEFSQGERDVARLFGMTPERVNALGARGTGIYTDGTLVTPDGAKVQPDQFAAYAKGEFNA